MNEKHFPANGDLPLIAQGMKEVSEDILIKLSDDLYVIGFFDWSEHKFHEYTTDMRWSISAVEAWWYLPE